MGFQGVLLEWEPHEEELLAAVVHEFGRNFNLVADVMAHAAHLSGFSRTADCCEKRYQALQVTEPTRNAGKAFHK